MVLHLHDEGDGIDGASVSIRVDGNLIYAGDVDTHRTAHGVCHRSGTKEDYVYTYQQQTTYDYGREVSVRVNARDLAGNVMPEQTYCFATAMYSFGVNRSVCADQTDLTQGWPATVGDSQGNLWVIWHAGSVGARHIYATCVRPDADAYGSTVQVSQGAGDHCRPAVALDSMGILYVVWQENAGGVWDVCMSKSADGNTWSPPQRVAGATDSQANPAANRVNPVVAAGRQPGAPVAVAWQEDRAGNQDIYIASSTNQFTTSTFSQVTFGSQDQIDPAVAVGDQGTIFVLWTDVGSGSTDICGAASDDGPWTNRPVVSTDANQSHPAVALGSSDGALHLVWVEDGGGDLDISYAVSEGLPTSPLIGASIIDDTSGANQQAPAIAVAAGVDGFDRVFVCWEDERNMVYSGDVDLYFADVSAGSLRTNVLVGDEGTSGNLREVALGTDWAGYPYVVWADDAGPSIQLYSSGVTYADPVPLAQREISAASGGTVGTPPEDIATLDDVSVIIPAAACPVNVTISIARIWNPRGFATESLRHYEFGPSGLTFSEPVTITIPYPTNSNGKLKAYWVDSVTGTFTDEGVTEVQDISLGKGRKALQFKTNHFTPFYLVPEDTPGTAGNGGGCSLAAYGQADPAGHLAPYLMLVAVMIGLRRSDARRRSVRSRHTDSCAG